MGMLSALRPYRRRLAILVVLAALAGAALGELAPARPSTAKTSGASAHRQPGDSTRH